MRDAYDAWGNGLAHFGSAQQPYQYVGRLGYYAHYQNPAFPLLQVNTGYYEPSVGRLPSRSPANINLNPYLYASNRPTVSTDAFSPPKPWWEPDYFVGNLYISVPNALTYSLVGFTLQVAVNPDTGDVFVGGGVQVGRAPAILGASGQLGWILAGSSTNQFLSGPNLNIGGGFLLGGGLTGSGWIPGANGAALQGGWATPQLGVSWTYNLYVWTLPGCGE